MDEDLKKQLEEIMRRSRELADQTEKLTEQAQELRAQTETLLKQFREGEKTERESGRKKLGST